MTSNPDDLHDFVFFFREHQDKRYRALSYIIPAIVLSFLINISRFLEIELVEHCIDYVECGLPLITVRYGICST